jgi:phosphoglycolate phosphatase
VARFDLVILDLDGTIYSSTSTTLGAVERAVRDLNRRHGLDVPVPEETAILGGIGRTRGDFARAVFPDLDDRYYGDVDELIWRWENVLISEGLGSLYPGANEALDELADDGYRLALATNAGGGYMDRILDVYDLRRYFADIRCAGCENTTDKARLIRRNLETLGVPPERAVMVGDRASDVDAARRAGTAAIGCTWGFGSEDELAGADRVAHSMRDVPALLRDWDGGAP